MTMPRPSLRRALAAWCLVLISAGSVVADEDSTTTTTLTSTQTVQTLTTTITNGQTTFATTEHLTPGTTIVIPGATPTMSYGSGHGSYSGTAFKSAVLNSTNYWRAQHQAKPLTWNDKLAEFAQNHAQKCIWEHSVRGFLQLSSDQRTNIQQGGPYGENLAENFGSPTLAVDGWAAEEKKYDYATGQFSEETGHFTQLVWENTKEVGCGAVNCNNDANDGAHGWYLVCEYSPPGNVVGQFKENVSKQGMADGKLGFGGAPKIRLAHSLMALVAVSGFVVVYL
jgi:uncharacterized protein YkwD